MRDRHRDAFLSPVTTIIVAAWPPNYHISKSDVDDLAEFRRQQSDVHEVEPRDFSQRGQLINLRWESALGRDFVSPFFLQV